MPLIRSTGSAGAVLGTLASFVFQSGYLLVSVAGIGICGHLVSNTTSIDTNLKLVKVSVHLTLSIDSVQKTLRTYEYSIVVQSCRN